MQSQSKLSLGIVFRCLLVLAVGFFAQQAFAEQQQKAAEMSFPYTAQITGDNVNIRSGPGTNYYSCDKLNKTETVEIIGRQFSWSRIIPPKGCFSWISMRYVKTDATNPAVGIVTGDAVRVYAGSEQLKPIHSTTLQLKLNRGDKVKLLGEEKDDYYKITPPAGAYLWVLSEYTKALEKVIPVPAAVEQEPEIKKTVEQKIPEVPAAPEAPAVTISPISTEAELLNNYYTLQKQIKTERAKPTSQQNYAQMKKGFTEIVENKNAGKAGRYAKFTLGQIEKYELALSVQREFALQNTELAKIRKRIDAARDAKLAEIADLGSFAAVGTFKHSEVFARQVNRKYYRIVDESGKITCYALPVGLAVKRNPGRLINKKVGLIGKIKKHPQTAGALVEFTQIVELK